MTAVQAVYDGRVFIPETPCDISSGSTVKLTIEAVNDYQGVQKKLTAFRRLTDEITELNKTDPLPQEFDKILSQRVQFREIGNL